MTRVLTIAFGAFLLAGCSVKAEPQDSIEGREQVAGRMVRLGYDRWVAACAFHTARNGGSREDADKNCRVDFHFPERGE